jgi:hypothetical protein
MEEAEVVAAVLEKVRPEARAPLRERTTRFDASA